MLAAYDLCLKCSHLFNILDARGAISVTERVGVIARVRALAVGIAKAYVDQQASEESKSTEKNLPLLTRTQKTRKPPVETTKLRSGVAVQRLSVIRSHSRPWIC